MKRSFKSRLFETVVLLGLGVGLHWLGVVQTVRDVWKDDARRRSRDGRGMATASGETRAPRQTAERQDRFGLN